MVIPLLADSLRQWWDTIRLQDRMHRDLPGHYREEWRELSWSRYQYQYGVLVPMIIHDALFRLHNLAISSQHRKVITAQALVTGLFDDLFDTINLPIDRILHLMDEPDYIISTDYIQEHLCQYLYKEIYEHFTGYRRTLEDAIQGIMKAQKKTAQQRNPDLSLKDMLQITREKGGNAVLFYRSCIHRPIQEEEREFLFDLGGLFQLINDVNDAVRDLEAGEITIMSSRLSLHEIKQIIMDQLAQVLQSWNNIPDEDIHREHFFDRIHILTSRCLLTLDRYIKFSNPDEPFDIRRIPQQRIVSGLSIPVEIVEWQRQYKNLMNSQ